MSFVFVIQRSIATKDLVDNHVDAPEIFRASPQQLVFTALRSVLNDKYFKKKKTSVLICVICGERIILYASGNSGLSCGPSVYG